MKKIVGILVIMLVFTSFAGAMSPINISIKTKGKEPVNRAYSHVILSEFATTSTCVYCKYSHAALKRIYKEEWHPFYFITFVYDKNTHAWQRMKNEYSTSTTPTVYWDGGFRMNLGATSNESAMAKYNTSIIACGNRDVADIDLTLDVEWLGAVNMDPEDQAINVTIEQIMTWTNSEMKIDIEVVNNEDSQYSGNVRAFVTEVYSTMHLDKFNFPYAFEFKDYAYNEDVAISAGDTWDTTVYWDCVDYDDGHQHSFENMTQNNTMVIATVFDEDNDYTDETAGFRAGYEVDPKEFDVYFGNVTPPPKQYSNVTITSYVPPVDLIFNQTYYWKVDVWDDLDNPTYGEIINFTTRGNWPPYVPSNPWPRHNSTNAYINTNLTWTGGDPDENDTVTYDVYFGTEYDELFLVTENISEESFNPPGELEFETWYFWKIISWDPYERKKEGPIWIFKTEENQPPHPAYDPFPPDGANPVPINATLKWNGSDPNPGDTLTYDVYFGVTNPPTQKSWNQTDTFFEPESDMELFKDYYWRVVTWDSQEEKTSGPNWTFHTGINHKPNDPVVVGNKQGGPDIEYEFTFSSVDPDENNVSIYVDWGDGNNAGWSDEILSGEEITLNHSWAEKGTYDITAKAIDIYDAESGWTRYTFQVPKNKPYNFKFYLLELLIERFLNTFPILRYLLELK